MNTDLQFSLSLEEESHMLIGRFQDLEALVDMLNGAWESVDYRLDKVKGQRGTYLFVEDPVGAEEYECGIILKKKGNAYSLSPAVHHMVMGAYNRYVEEFGEPELE